MKPSQLIGERHFKLRRLLTTLSVSRYPAFLYKYRSTIDKWVEKTLLDSEIYLSSRDQFNDPMDIAYRVKPAPDDKTRWDRYVELMTEYGKSYDELVALWSTAGTAEQEIAWQRKLNDHMIENMGIHSLSETARSMLMWSHYGNSHKGICLQFYLPAGFDEIQTLLPVEYGTEMKLIGYRDPEAQPLDAFKFKSIEWKYEQEWRVIKPNLARQSVKLPPTMLKAIVFGAKCPPEEMQRATAINEQRIARGLPPLHFLQAHLSEHYYHVGISTYGVKLPPSWRGRATTRRTLAEDDVRTHRSPQPPAENC